MSNQQLLGVGLTVAGAIVAIYFVFQFIEATALINRLTPGFDNAIIESVNGRRIMDGVLAAVGVAVALLGVRFIKATPPPAGGK